MLCCCAAEIQLNRRPLSYVQEDVQLAVLTSASFLFQRSNQLPEQQPLREEDVDLRKRARYLMAWVDFRVKMFLNVVVIKLLYSLKIRTLT